MSGLGLEGLEGHHGHVMMDVVITKKYRWFQGDWSYEWDISSGYFTVCNWENGPLIGKLTKHEQIIGNAHHQPSWNHQFIIRMIIKSQPLSIIIIKSKIIILTINQIIIFILLPLTYLRSENPHVAPTRQHLPGSSHPAGWFITDLKYP